jgi:hypothetical protein
VVAVGVGTVGEDDEVALTGNVLSESRDPGVSILTVVESGVKVEAGVADVELPGRRNKDAAAWTCGGFGRYFSRG